MAARSSGQWPIGTTRMRGIADLLVALYGSESACYKIIDAPEEIRSTCVKIADFWISFGKLQLKHIPLFHGGVGSFYYNMWAPSGTVWHQEDAVAWFSPEIYEEFIFPYDQRIVSSFPNCIMHLHPSGFLPIDNYLQLPFTAMELHIDEGGPDAQALYEFYYKILAKKPLLIWGKLSEKDLNFIFQKLPRKGLAVMTVVENQEQAHAIWDIYRKYNL